MREKKQRHVNTNYIISHLKARSQDCEKLRHVCPCVRLSAWNNSTPIARIFMKSDISAFFKNLSRKKNSISINLTRIAGTLQKAQYTFCIISRSVVLRMRNTSNKSRGANQNTYFMFNNFMY